MTQIVIHESVPDWGKIKLRPGGQLKLTYTYSVDAPMFTALSRKDFIDQAVLLYRRKVAAMYDSVKVKP